MDVQEYMKLPYSYMIKPIQDESGSYFHASVLELDGCQSTGETFKEAYDGLMETMEANREGISLNQYTLYKLSH